MSALDDFVYELEELLTDEGPFEDEDDVRRYIDDHIENSFIYDDDIFDMAKHYLHGTDILRMFFDEFVCDVHSQIRYDDYVEEEEEEEYWDDDEEYEDE